ncbi:cobalt-precorrin-5B (C(1))-methyltransferase [Streptomyces sp. DSM 44917]|uniref:Cobalt-precorrin-5B C(1)-methyltransferase n=1 Tax=Streptomyces boetiae TaxID=3075541 RepID=A0ABU2L5D6_9ACTN|nr:cobalt-precorrin-5B (C(1))-methyltransferase [Streptomyces sp. DSM 44917]MDT0306784.1 cobalt-precorrin-5B (C(1))-methyltransferase [Streptomyces sp. DSM 44917]
MRPAERAAPGADGPGPGQDVPQDPAAGEAGAQGPARRQPERQESGLREPGRQKRDLLEPGPQETEPRDDARREPGTPGTGQAEPERPEPELREPDLPRTAKVRQGRALRTGWTTGTCASAAARAAALHLATGTPQRWVEVALPSGRRVTFAVERAELLREGRAEAVVVKDAGDDPDVTHGSELTATVSWRPAPGLALHGGLGVGVVTRPGLGLDVGGPAINPVPRRMIGQAVREVIDTEARGVDVTISVPDGELRARRTTNARLGIIGGISILGTTGIVRPFSTASWRASVEQAVSVAAAQGAPAVALCTGGRTERGAMALLPGLPPVAFVEVGDFTGAALRRAVEGGLERVVFVGMIGKLTKLASGVLMTHYTRSRVDTGVLGEITRAVGGPPELAGAVDAANTARHAYELWEAAGLLAPAGRELCARVARVLSRFTDGRIAAEAALVDFTGSGLIASAPGGGLLP